MDIPQLMFHIEIPEGLEDKEKYHARNIFQFFLQGDFTDMIGETIILLKKLHDN